MAKKNTVEIDQDVLSALLANSRLGSPQGSSLQDMMSKYLAQGDLPTQATEQDSFINPGMGIGQFRNQEYQPRASGVPYIFTGGSPFPQSPGQQRAEKVYAGGALGSNMLGSLNNVLPALIDAWRKRKGQGGK